MTELIYHITSRAAWSAAQKTGAYTADSLSSQGFIHCSRMGQVLRVANTFYANQQGLVILEIDSSQLVSGIRWEPVTDKADELFPHIYGQVNLEAVVRVLDFEPGSDGRFSLPMELL